MTAPVKRGLSCLMPAAAPLYLENYEVVNKVILMSSATNIYYSIFVIYPSLEARQKHRCEAETYCAVFMNQVDASFEWESPDPCFPCLWDISSGLFLFPVTY